MPRILVTDDEPSFGRLRAALASKDHELFRAKNADDALAQLETRRFQLLVTELSAPFDGLSLLRKAAASRPDLACVVWTASPSVDDAVLAMKLGAIELLRKAQADEPAIVQTIGAALERSKLRRRIEETTMSQALNAPQLSFGAPAMRPVVEGLKKVAATSATVLLVGESGTGKEVAARALHFWSPRRLGPFVAINCAALTETLLEGELFGHEKGAFSGADKRRIGRIEHARGGTFFLDEVAELRPDLQAKLLRVLQEKKIQRVGGNESIAVDVRWVAATNQDLESAMKRGQFREDLFHRLAVFPLRLPPLRERREDIVPLAEKLLFTIACELGRLGLSFDAEARAFLREGAYPGNVRELRNVIERAAILADGPAITRGALAQNPFGAGSSPSERHESGERESPATAPMQTLDEMERAAITRALAEHGGHRKKTAAALGVSLRTLYDKLKKYGLR